MNCQQFVELVTEYLEQVLPPATQTECDAHARSCAGCGEYLEQMRRTILLLGRMIDESVDPATRDDLMGRFRAIQAGGQA